MTITSYTTLKSAIAAWLGTTKLTSVIPDFIGFCEADLNGRLRHPEMVVTRTATFDEVRESLPTDLVEPIALYLSTETPRVLGYVPPTQFPSVISGNSGTPTMFTVIGNQVRCEPQPSGSPVVEIVYYRSLPALADNETNWLLTKDPSVYLCGSLLHAAPYLRDDARVSLWKAAYDERVARLNQQGRKAMTSLSRLRTNLPTGRTSVDITTVS